MLVFTDTEQLGIFLFSVFIERWMAKIIETSIAALPT
jgi:hypothetical protein